MRRTRLPEWWREFWSLLQHLYDSSIQNWPANKPWPSGNLPHSWRRGNGGPPHPVWKCWGRGNTFPWKISRGAVTTEKWGGKKQLPWPWLLRAALCNLEGLQECYVEWCRSSASVLLPSLRKTVSWIWRCWMLLKRTHGTYIWSHFFTPDPEEEDQVVQVPEESCTLEPEETAHSEGGLDLVWGRYPSIPLGFGGSQANWACTGLQGVYP